MSKGWDQNEKLFTFMEAVPLAKYKFCRFYKNYAYSKVHIVITTTTARISVLLYDNGWKCYILPCLEVEDKGNPDPTACK